MSQFNITKNKLQTAWNQVERNRISLIVNDGILSSNRKIIQNSDKKQNNWNKTIDLSSDWISFNKFEEDEDFTLYQSWQIIFPIIRPIISTFLDYSIVYKVGEDLKQETKLTKYDRHLYNIVFLSNWQEIDVGYETMKKMIFNASISIKDNYLNPELEDTDLIKVKLFAQLINPMEYV